MLRKSIDWTTDELDELTRHRLIRRLIGLEVSALLESTQQKIAAADLKSVEALQMLDHNVVGFSDEYLTMNQQLRTFLFANMYQHYRVVRMQTKAERFIEELFNAYVEKPEILPKKVQARAKTRESYRTICDYLAGMTDRFALKEYSKLFDPATLP